ncbi:MAG: flagellar basal body L-ring protein FlgH [Pseudomonadota bacterium]
MTRHIRVANVTKQILALGLITASLSACSVADRVKNIGSAPSLSPIEEVETPVQPASLGAPIIAARRAVANEGQGTTSLYRTGARAFFKDQRAANVGDILTVNIDISDRAQVGNTTTRTRDSSENAGLSNFLGFEGSLGSFLPDAVNPGALVDYDSQSSTVGNGQVQRSENINMTVAALVTHVLPNGNMIVQGRQEVRVNFEKRELLIAGVVRPQDIAADNTIDHTQIAEARIVYGGKGQLTDVQQARYGQQLYEILFPF